MNRVFYIALSFSTVDEIAQLLKDGKGFGEIVKENIIHPGKISSKVKETRTNETNDNTVQSTPTVAPTETSEEPKEQEAATEVEKKKNMLQHL